MPERYELDEPQAWVEFGDSWTRGELLRFADLQGDEYFSFIAAKLKACSIPIGDETTLDDPAQFIARMDDVDARFFYWLASAVMPLEYGRIGRLGESTGRQWLKSYVEKMTPEPLTAPPSS